MNINPFGPTVPHYDSYDDFYKFFEIPPKETKEGGPVEVFPPPGPTQEDKEEKTTEQK